MYKIVILILFLLISGCKVQNEHINILPIINSKVNYSNVIEVEGVSKDKLYNRANHWLLKFDEYTNKIIYTDKYKKIISKRSFKELWGPNDYDELYIDVLQTVNLEFREGRYKYEITNFIVKKNEKETQIEIYKMNDKKNMKYNKLFHKKIDHQIKNLITSLEKSMTLNVPIVK